MSDFIEDFKRVYDRVVEHDPRSWFHQADRAAAVTSVNHVHYGPVLDQGQVGSCTGNAASQCLNTDPFRASLAAKGTALLTETDAVGIYTWATHHDGIPGAYPAQDTGSSGLAVAKAAKVRGYIKSYAHAFGLQHTLEALTLKPVIIGTQWTDAMERPDADGTIHFKGNVVGGHETCLVGIDLPNKRVRGLNSWSDQWGDKGFYWLSFADLDALLSQQGDCTVFNI